ncbi:hypothetical protein WK23_01855 [Burkholderia vietnamiensis]|nr:hypothetical protein WK23_01855 [Burkholderia vietnamiensis]
METFECLREVLSKDRLLLFLVVGHEPLPDVARTISATFDDVLIAYIVFIAHACSFRSVDLSFR